jgi:ATP synthase protein I
MNRRPDPETYRTFRTLVDLSVIGLTMAFSVAIGVVIGVLLDRWLGTNWLVILFAVFGVVAGFKQMIRAVTRANREEEQQDLLRRTMAISREKERVNLDTDECEADQGETETEQQ